MSQFSHTALLFLKLNLLRRARKGVLSKILGRKLFSPKTAIMFKAIMALLFVVVTCLVPLLTLSDFGASTDFGQNLIKFHHLIINGIIILLFYSGLFVGASMIYGLTTAENEQLLAYPIVMADLVQYKVVETLLVVLNSCLYFFIPIMVLVFLALGWSAIWIAALTILTTMLLITVFLLGINVMLSTAKLMPRRGSDRIIIGFFLISIVLLLVAAKLFGMGYYGPGDMALLAWLDQQLSQFSYSLMMDNIVSQARGIGQYVLSLVACSMLLFFLVKMCERSLDQAYHRIIKQANDMTIQPKQDTIGLSFAKLNCCMGFLPLDLRTLLAKDILALVRGPNLLLKAIGAVVALVLVIAWRHSSLANPVLFGLYFFPTFIISRFFIDIVGQERNNILLIKQLYPSPSRYLSTRFKITFSISFIVLFPIWVLLVCTTMDFTLSEAIWRAPLLILTLGLTSILVTWYSAAFAEFSKDHIEKYKFCIHPVAMLLFWGFSGLVSLFFYKLDLAVLAHKSDNLTIILIVVMGIVLAVSMAVFKVLAIRRIKHYA